jgi:uncharacterized membrane protein required for colicin V production
MELSQLSVNWFDVVVLATAGVGIILGRRHGMSEELLTLLQWLSIILIGGYTYRELGTFTSTLTGLDLNICYVVAYVGVASLLKWLFTVLKHSVGSKLVTVDTFGKSEYYLGMVAGVLRCFCMLLFCISLISSVYITPKQRTANRRMQEDNFGFTFPTLGSIQEDVLHKSFTGPYLRKYAAHVLIDPQPTRATPKTQDLRSRKQKELDEVTGTK